MAIRRGETHPSAKLTDTQVLDIRRLWKMGHRNVRVMARNHKVSSSNILKIVRNETWTHLNEFWSGSL
jgi:hypothetical protein